MNVSTTRLAHIISEVFAPWVVNIALFLILAQVTGAWGPGIAASVGTGVMPMVVIVTLMRRGKVGDHHVTDRSQRGLVLVGIFLCVCVLIAVLWALETPRLIWVGVLSAFVFLLIFAILSVGMKIKASIHVGLWVCVVTYLGLVVSPLWLCALIMTPVIAWARIVIKHHTALEVAAGVLGGIAVTGICYVLFLL